MHYVKKRFFWIVMPILFTACSTFKQQKLTQSDFETHLHSRSPKNMVSDGGFLLY